MTEKRYTFDNKSLLKDNEFWLDGQIATLCNAEEICELLNELAEENIKLRWILRHYNPQDLNLDFDDEKFKKQMELLYSEKEFLE